MVEQNGIYQYGYLPSLTSHLKDYCFVDASFEDSDQSVRMLRLLGGFSEHEYHIVGFD